ncbi:MAG: 4Fe-4S dicluster domain-containing protein, partial [Bacillota bacterium]
MAHKTAKSAYKSLEERLNQFPQGAPPSETLYKILEILFSEKEAKVVAQLPIKPFTVEKASRILKEDPVKTEKILDELASRAILLDSQDDGVKKYVLPPPMAGFFEFSMMRVRHDIDQQLLAELYHQYLNVEEDFIKELFLSTETKLGRVFVQEEVLSQDNLVHILDFERSSHIIEEASHIGISTCYCRHKMHHVGQACDSPLDICMTFNSTADSLIRHGHARKVEVSECMELLHQAYEKNLVQCGENVRKEPAFICNCCGCCCEALVAVKKFGSLNPIETANYLPEVNHETCTACGRCIEACQVDVIKWSKKSNDDMKKQIEIDKDVCLGCGVCVRACPNGSLELKRR